MYRKLALSGSVIPATKKNIITNEIDTTKPGESNTGVVTGSGVVVGVSLCNTGEVYWNVRYGCQPSSVLAIADYSLPPISVGINPVNLDIRKPDGTIVPVPNISYIFPTTLV